MDAYLMWLCRLAAKDLLYILIYWGRLVFFVVFIKEEIIVREASYVYLFGMIVDALLARINIYAFFC